MDGTEPKPGLGFSIFCVREQLDTGILEKSSPGFGLVPDLGEPEWGDCL